MSSRTDLRFGSLRNDKQNATERKSKWDKPEGDVGLNQTQHLLGSLGGLDEDTIVDLQQPQKLQDLAGLGRDVVNTEMVSDTIENR
jgi:hypothetical protein